MRLLLVCVSMFAVISELSANDSSVYDFEWVDKDKEVYVLQNRKYRKSSRLNLAAMGGVNLSEKFIDRNIATLKAGYFFSEDWAIEFSYTVGIGQKQNNTAAGVLEQGAVPFYREIDNQMSLSILWSPFYGKFNTFNKIFYLDWFISAGLTSVTTADNRNQFVNFSDLSLVDDTSTGAIWGTGFLFHINQSWSVRLEFNGTHVQFDRFRRIAGEGSTFSTKTWFHNYDLSIGINFQI